MGIINWLLMILCRFQRAKPIIIDPGLYMTKKADVFWITQRRSLPTAFKLFTGTKFLNLEIKACHLLPALLNFLSWIP